MRTIFWHTLLAMASGVRMRYQQCALKQYRRSKKSSRLGGGCFWCLEEVYNELKGVTRVESGYAGGTLANPDYRQVSSGSTGHAEVVQITFDPAQLSLENLLRVYFTLHDPTTLNRQGNDVARNIVQ